VYTGVRRLFLLQINARFPGWQTTRSLKTQTNSGAVYICIYTYIHTHTFVFVSVRVCVLISQNNARFCRRNSTHSFKTQQKFRGSLPPSSSPFLLPWFLSFSLTRLQHTFTLLRTHDMRVNIHIYTYIHIYIYICVCNEICADMKCDTQKNFCVLVYIIANTHIHPGRKLCICIYMRDMSWHEIRYTGEHGSPNGGGKIYAVPMLLRTHTLEREGEREEEREG